MTNPNIVVECITDSSGTATLRVHVEQTEIPDDIGETVHEWCHENLSAWQHVTYAKQCISGNAPAPLFWDTTQHGFVGEIDLMDEERASEIEAMDAENARAKKAGDMFDANGIAVL